MGAFALRLGLAAGAPPGSPTEVYHGHGRPNPVAVRARSSKRTYGWTGT
jgi:hypothetical protein